MAGHPACHGLFIAPQAISGDRAKLPVPPAIANFAGTTGSGFEVPWGSIMAATVIVTVPIVVLVLIFQRKILAGLTAGAVKG